MNIVSVSQEACGGVFPEMARFMASKGGVATSAEAAPLPLADMGVDCNANHPGALDAGITKDMRGSS